MPQIILLGLEDTPKNRLMAPFRLEHNDIVTEIESLHRRLLQVQKADKSSKSSSELLETLQLFLDRITRHMQLEEQMLYTFLPCFIDKDLIDLMISAHQNLTESIADIKIPRGKNSLHFSSQWFLGVNNFLSLKKEHLRKESAVVFWLAEVKTRRSTYFMA